MTALLAAPVAGVLSFASCALLGGSFAPAAFITIVACLYALLASLDVLMAAGAAAISFVGVSLALTASLPARIPLAETVLALIPSLAVAAILVGFSHTRRWRTVAGLGLAVALIFLAVPLQAADVVTKGDTATIVPYGDWIVGIAQTIEAVLIPVVTALIMGVIGHYLPFLSLFVKAPMVERAVRNAGDFAMQSISGMAKGQTIDLNMGSTIIAAGAQRMVDQAPGWLSKAAGGPAGIAEKLFRVLPLHPEATARNTLLPALAAIQPKTA